MATAYTILYGSEKAGFGPGVAALVSRLAALEGVEVTSATAAGGGGGSMTGAGDAGVESGSGSDGMSSSADEVSIVICFVCGWLFRSV